MSKYYCVRCSEKPKGAIGILIDMCNLRARRKDIPASWFRRACKRNGVSRTKPKEFLRIHFGIGYVFPIQNPFKELDWWNYAEWLGKNQQVAKGEVSYAREWFTGIAIFNSYQIVGPKRNFLLSMIEFLEVEND